MLLLNKNFLGAVSLLALSAQGAAGAPTGAEALFPVAGEDGLAILFADADPDLAINWASTPASEYNGDPFGKLTFTRASTAYYYNSSGVLTQAASGAARYDHNPLTPFAPRGLLVEEQRTNLAVRSQEFDNGSWTKTRSTIGANAVAAPDGTTTADQLIEDSTATSDHTTFQLITAADSTIYTASIFAKQNTRRYLALQIASKDTTRKRYTILVDLLDGGVETSRSLNTPVNASHTTPEQLPDGWWRLTISINSGTAGNANILLKATLSDSAAPTWGATDEPTYSGDGTSGFYIFGAQVEAGTSATSYIPTTSASVTRAADSVSILNSLLPFSATVGTLIVKARVDSIVGNRTLAAINNNTVSEEFRLRYNASSADYLVWDGGVAVVASVVGTAVADVSRKFGGAWSLNDFAASYNGGAVATDGSGTLPTVDRLFIGAETNAVTFLNGWVEQLIYLPRRMTNGDLQTFTT